MADKTLPNPTVEVPSWSPYDDYSPSIDFHFPLGGISGDHSLAESALIELQRYLPLNDISPESDDAANLTGLPVDRHSSDEFRMYEFKIRRCTRSRSHDWTECPYAHPGEKARRRDPRRNQYSGVACPDFRKGSCKKGDACEFAHGVFECWLHPARYRTQHCKDGTACRRRVCFFAHTPEQIRVLPIGLRDGCRGVFDSYDGSPQRNQALEGVFAKGVIPSSPRSTLISPPMSSPANSPPVSPVVRRFEVMAAIAKMHLGKVIGFRPVLCGSPAMVSAPPAAGGVWGWLDEEEEVVGRVESGRALRAKMYERVRKESGLTRPEADPAGGSGPDVGWVSELIK